MDNAGGHGTKEATEEYTNYLKQEYNIEVVFQVPRSPYTNVLDLGVWCALQAAVERTHFMRRAEVNALVQSVNDTWDNGHLDRTIEKVFQRLQKVLVLVVRDNGKNNLVESCHGKKFINMSLPEESHQTANHNNENDGRMESGEDVFDLELESDSEDDGNTHVDTCDL